MTPGIKIDSSWMWHPSFSEHRKNTAGAFVHFRTSLDLKDDGVLPSLRVQITADTRYKLYVNSSLVSYGPVKGDEHLWFYDEVDIGPWLRRGRNTIAVVVLRFFYATTYATSFPRLPTGGLRIVPAEGAPPEAEALRSGPFWETAIDEQTILRVDEPEDDFLHVYEHARRSGEQQDTWIWTSAEVLPVRTSTGNSAPWNLSPRLIPLMERRELSFRSVRNVRSSLPVDEWQSVILRRSSDQAAVRLPAGSTHYVDLEAPEHATAFLKLRFQRALASRGRVTILYAESYEDEPRLVPYLRSKGHRLDDTKELYGPKDVYEIGGLLSPEIPLYEGTSTSEEIIAPFHWRTFRFIRLKLEAGPDEELIFLGIGGETATYPLNIVASVESPGDEVSSQLWSTSLRTLRNCMHDCYEDCPLYEQLQYAMDSRSSILFTYYSSGDDRLARQAMTQIHHSFNPALGLTASRAPSHKRQVIPHFSLYWILTLCDHMRHFDDVDFLSSFLPVVDAVLAYFGRRVNSKLGLIVLECGPGVWNFVDWAEEWRPYGIPPSTEKSGISTYTNLLYAHALKSVAAVVSRLGRQGVAREYLIRADEGIQAVQKHCFDGSFFTDSLASETAQKRPGDYSQHSQVWAVLSGAVGADQGREMLRRCLEPGSGFVLASVSMAFYTLRALSSVGGSLYDDKFHGFWAPWREQLALGCTTWEEDSVSQRSDCHAWGSAPIYEFMAEVAGVRPLQPGWAAISVRPRIKLYTSFSAVVPVGRARGEPAGTVSVAWQGQESDDAVTVKIVCDFGQSAAVPVHIELPGEAVRLLDSSMKEVSFTVRR